LGSTRTPLRMSFGGTWFNLSGGFILTREGVARIRRFCAV
jgi:hypothetical protein